MKSLSQHIQESFNEENNENQETVLENKEDVKPNDTEVIAEDVSAEK